MSFSVSNLVIPLGGLSITFFENHTHFLFSNNNIIWSLKKKIRRTSPRPVRSRRGRRRGWRRRPSRTLSTSREVGINLFFWFFNRQKQAKNSTDQTVLGETRRWKNAGAFLITKEISRKERANIHLVLLAVEAEDEGVDAGVEDPMSSEHHHTRDQIRLKAQVGSFSLSIIFQIL